MLFSEAYGIQNAEEHEWFDPILNHDTHLFIDPFLIFKTKAPIFSSAHAKIVEFFNSAFKLAAESAGDPNHLAYKKLLNLLVFPEVSELCLGYTQRSTFGAGSALLFAKTIAKTLLESIKVGLVNIQHFEKLGILDKGMGRDRISDMTANILKADFITYTQKIIKQHNVPTQKFKISIFDQQYLRWNDEIVDLPLNPTTGEAVFLTPEEFLRELPTIHDMGFWDFCWDNKSEKLRTDFNYEIKSKTSKDDIIKVARQRPDWLEEYTRNSEALPPDPYNLKVDPKLLYKWYKVSKKCFDKIKPLKKNVKNKADFLEIIRHMISCFKKYVENQSGYRLLWNETKTKPRGEESAQLLFMGIVSHYCRAENIDPTREADIGRGPVDFKFSSGYQDRVLIELKLARSKKLAQGLKSQLPQYMTSENVDKGIYVIIEHGEKDYEKTNVLRDELEEVKRATGYDLEIISIDATLEKPSGSKIKTNPNR